MSREFKEIASRKKDYLELLLLADEQEDMIDRYLPQGRMFVLTEGGAVCGVAVVADLGEGVCELKNIAVEPRAQRQGHGRAMVEYLAAVYGPTHHTMVVGTGEVPSSLGFYHSCGFIDSHRVPNFFTDHYRHPMVEDGVLLVDMVYLKRKLP